MTAEPEHAPDKLLSVDDEHGSIEAAEPPAVVTLPSDPYIADPHYDESLASLDPEEQGVDLPVPEE